MKMHATGTLEVKSWDEKTWDGKPWKEVPGAKLTHAIVTQSLHGDIEGVGTTESVTVYVDDSTASYVGLKRVDGRIGSRLGSFVLQEIGTFQNGTAETKWSVVPASGTGDLRGLRGEGSYIARHGGSHIPYTLDYDLD